MRPLHDNAHIAALVTGQSRHKGAITLPAELWRMRLSRYDVRITSLTNVESCHAELIALRPRYLCL